MKIIKIYTDSCPLNPCGQGGIEFSNGSVLVDLHDQDCCENVYADFSNLDSDIMSYDFKGANNAVIAHRAALNDNVFA